VSNSSANHEFGELLDGLISRRRILKAASAPPHQASSGVAGEGEQEAQEGEQAEATAQRVESTPAAQQSLCLCG
jgi:hypothetical protein